MQPGCDLAPISSDESSRFEFAPEEVELLARLEHERFVEERLRDGWSYSPGPKDVDRKTSPYLAPYDQLPEEVREMNRISVRELPMLLTTAGLQIYRIPSELKDPGIK